MSHHDTSSSLDEKTSSPVRIRVSSLQKDDINKKMALKEDLYRKKVINMGRQKLHTIINIEDIGEFKSKLTEEEEKKKMITTNIPSSLLSQIFSLTGSKGMVNFLALSSNNSKLKENMRIDLSDTPLTLAQIEENRFTDKYIITGLHVLIPHNSDLTMVIPTLITTHITKLIISYESYMSIPNLKERNKEKRKQESSFLSISASMPKLISLSLRKRVNVKNFKFLMLSSELEYAELNEYLSSSSLVNCTKLKFLYIFAEGNFSLKKLEKLQNITSLEELILPSLSKEISFQLDKFTNLKYLQLESFVNDDLNFLSGCHNLECLVMSECRLYNLDSLINLPNLFSLHLMYCYNLDNINGLKSLPQLKYLTIRRSKVIDIKILALCTKLEELNTDFLPQLLSQVESFPSIKLLILYYLRIVPYSEALVYFPNLDFLMLMNPQSRLNLAEISSYTNLKRVWYVSLSSVIKPSKESKVIFTQVEPDYIL